MGLIINDGGGLTPSQESTIDSLQGLDQGQIPSATGTGDFDYSGATKSPVDDEVTFDKATNFTQASINISDPVTISEATFTPFFRDNVLDTGSVNAVAVIDESGTGPLTLLAATKEQTVIAQSDDGTEFNANPFTAALLSTNANQTNAVTIRTASEMLNTRMTITDNVSGLVVKYIPNEAAVRMGTGGLDLRAGDNRVDFDSNITDDPVNGLFYIGHTPLRQFAGEASTFKIEADSVSILGNPSGTPFFQNEIQFLQPEIVPYVEDITHVADNFTRLNAQYTSGTATTGGMAITTKGMGVSDVVTSGQFTAGVDGVSNPTVETDGSDTFSQGDLVQVSLSKFNNHYVEVESHTGTTLTIRGVGTVGTVESFSDNDFTTALDGAVLTKVQVTVLRSGITGKLEQASGSETPLSFTELHDQNSKAVIMDAYMSTDLLYDNNREEKVIEFDTVSKSNLISLGANGEIEALLSGRYEGHIILQVNETSNPTIVVWSEVKPISTGVWELSGGMAKTRFKEDTSWTLTLDGSLELQAGDKVRVKAMMIGGGADKFELEGITESVDLGTIVQPSANIDIVRVGSLT